MAFKSNQRDTIKAFPNAIISLTFDDGWRCIYENAIPILDHAGIKATFYVISGCLDDARFPQYMNLDHLQQLESVGHEIGCHTVSHRHLIAEPNDLVESEILCSRRYLCRLGFDVETFAYPYGEHDNRIVDCVKRAGFLGARGTEDGFNDRSTDPLLLKTQAVKADTTVAEVCRWIDEALAKNMWLILMFHQIDKEGREWSALPETLEQIVCEFQKRHLDPITVRDGLKVRLHEQKRMVDYQDASNER